MGTDGLFRQIPALLAVLFRESFFAAGPLSDRSTWEWFLPLGPAGYAFNLVLIAGSILVLMNLERTFRNTTGHLRWQVKFMIVGVAGLFAARIYTDSLAVLFRVVNTDLCVINAGALIFASILMARAAARTERMELDIYISHSLLHSSFTVLLVGVYFIGVGLLAWLARSFGGAWSLPLTAFVLFAAMMGLGALLLSDKVRIRRKRLVSELVQTPPLRLPGGVVELHGEYDLRGEHPRALRSGCENGGRDAGGPLGEPLGRGRAEKQPLLGRIDGILGAAGEGPWGSPARRARRSFWPCTTATCPWTSRTGPTSGSGSWCRSTAMPSGRRR